MSTNLKVEYQAIDSIKPYKSNPKIHSNKQVEKIINSMKAFTFTVPITIDEENVIIAGHGRLLAAQKLGMEEVPVIKISHLTESQKKAYRIADNKLTEIGEWDKDLLKLEFIELEKLNLDFSLDITGFDMGEIDVMLDTSITEKSIEANEKTNAIPFIQEEEIVSKVGDIWQLGKHRIICGSSLEQDVFKKLFEDKKARMIFTDPPYNVKVDGHVCGNGKVKHKEFAMASGEMSSEEFANFLKSSCLLLKEYSLAGSLHFLCMGWRHIKELSIAGADVYDELKNICVWVKSNGGMGSLYRSQHELISVYKNGTVSHINNVELGVHGRYRTNVWNYAGVNSFGKNQDNLRYHPTVKAVEMVKDAILDASKRNDIVLDAFLGSGTTLIAAEECSRICYGIELEPLYIDTTIRRWQKIAGKSALHMQTGKSYNELLDEKIKGGN